MLGCNIHRRLPDEVLAVDQVVWVRPLVKVPLRIAIQKILDALEVPLATSRSIFVEQVLVARVVQVVVTLGAREVNRLQHVLLRLQVSVLAVARGLSV